MLQLLETQISTENELSLQRTTRALQHKCERCVLNIIIIIRKAQQFVYRYITHKEFISVELYSTILLHFICKESRIKKSERPIEYPEYCNTIFRSLVIQAIADTNTMTYTSLSEEK